MTARGMHSQGYSQQNLGSLFWPHEGWALAMTVRSILILAVTTMIGPPLVYGSSACMTESEARAKFPKAHLYWHGSEHCWDDSPGYGSRALAAVPVHSSRPALAPVPASSAQPALAVVPATSPGPETGGTDTGAQCEYSPCE
jgi:hypothetical protein